MTTVIVVIFSDFLSPARPAWGYRKHRSMRCDFIGSLPGCFLLINVFLINVRLIPEMFP